jgi:PTS system mannose-specific IIA component
MLIKILSSRGRPLEQLAGEAKTAGVQGIVMAGEVLRKKISGE